MGYFILDMIVTSTLVGLLTATRSKFYYMILVHRCTECNIIQLNKIITEQASTRLKITLALQGRQIGFLTSGYVAQYFQYVTEVFYRQLCYCTHYSTWNAYRYSISARIIDSQVICVSEIQLVLFSLMVTNKTKIFCIF